MLRDNFDEMMAKNPETDVLIISRWNEWGAQNLSLLDFGFVDQFNREYSRDIEPMKGGYTDNYFYQMCDIIRRFKGVLPPDEPTGKRTVDLDGGFDQWRGILPVFEDFEGDTMARDAYDVSKTIRYQDDTGRNDILETRITADGGMLYAYVRTAAPITDYRDGKNWMMLFIDADNDPLTGWEGYDFVINYAVIDGTSTTLCAYKEGVWQEIGTVGYRVRDCEMMLAIPRTLLGLTQDNFTLNFHWMDNVTDVYDLHSWFTTGDSAPERRNNYTLTLSVPYDAAEETLLPARAKGGRSYMPAVDLSLAEADGLQAGLRVTRYTLPARYGRMPDFGHIAANARETVVVGEVSVANLGDGGGDFALSFEGYVFIPADGVYAFPLKASDCARLRVDGRLVAEVVPTPAIGSDTPVHDGRGLRLAEGYHTIRLEYAEIGGGCPLLSLDGEWLFYCN